MRIDSGNFEGEIRDENLRRERVTRQQLRSKLRKKGRLDLSAVYAVVMEGSGSIVIPLGCKRAADGSRTRFATQWQPPPGSADKG
jgi:uncharacterized membrane protein YcaP (DUF421 family)